MKKKQSENYLDKKPLRNEKFSWSVDDGKVTLEVENKGVWNTLFQKILKKPRISYIHLDEMGSFIWPLLDGEKNYAVLDELMKFAPAVDNFFEKVMVMAEDIKVRENRLGLIACLRKVFLIIGDLGAIAAK